MERETLQDDMLTSCRPYIIEQLQKEVPDYLFDRKVLTEEEYQEIIKLKTREDQIKCLLDKLSGKHPDSFNVFFQYVCDWYDWIIRKYSEDIETRNNRWANLPNVLDIGEIPPLPLRRVKRNEYNQLSYCLYRLKRGEYVVVHGMRGCGKSTLVSQVLHDSPSIAIVSCKKNVFWLTIGHDSEELTAQQELCSRLPQNCYRGVQSLPLDSKSAKRILKERLKAEELTDCLLILDDVPSSTFVEAFDIGCKILITTDNKDIMNKTGKPIEYVQVSKGFTETETMKLFSMSIGSKELPPQAKDIHAICKGFPLTISLLSSQLGEHQEDVAKNANRWDTYVSKLKDEGISAAIGRYDKNRLQQVTSLYQAIGMRIDSLTPELKELYQTLALFMYDVNIQPEVLITFWNLSKKEVEDIMVQFEDKSLVIRAWNHVRNSYIYCVHDLLLDYLRRLLAEREREDLHSRFIQSYLQRFGDFSKFPVDDNYILLYLGYHLKEANRVNEFARIYLDLIFVEKKIKKFGAADLLLDFKRYKSLIVNDGENNKKYEDFVHFISRVAPCVSISNGNIIQFGLCESKESEVYKCALEFAQRGGGSRSINKYFKLLTDAPKENSPPIVYYNRDRGEIVTATFIYDEDVLVANVLGVIRRINIFRQKTVKTFTGHTSKVTGLELAKNKLYFLSTSDDGTVRIWCVNGTAASEQNTHEKPRTPSPQMKQLAWQDLFLEQRHSREAAVAVLNEHHAPIKCAHFSNNGSSVVTGGADSKVLVWSLILERSGIDPRLMVIGFLKLHSTEMFENCCFSDDDTFILCATRRGTIYTYSSTSGAQLSSVSTDVEIKSMIVISENPDANVFLLGENQFQVKKIPDTGSSVTSRLNRFNDTFGRKRNEHYMCAAVSWDGMFVAIASATNRIYVYDVVNDKEVLKFNESNGRISNLCWSRQNNLLLASYNSDILKIWNVQNKGLLNDAPKLKHSVFDSAWISDQDVHDDGLLISAVLDNTNRINVYHDQRLTEVLEVESPDVEICYIFVCPTTGDIIYACKNGRLNLIKLDAPEERQTVFYIPCTRVCKVKMFSCNEKLSFVLLVEKDVNEFVFGIWSREGDESPVSKLFKSQSMSAVFDYFADLNNDLLYVVQDDHTVNIYCSCSGSIEQPPIDLNSKCEVDSVEYCDISANFALVATGNNDKLYCRMITNRRLTLSLDWKESGRKMCKFKMDEEYLAIGFSNGNVHIYETTTFAKAPVYCIDNPVKFPSGPVIDVMWSLTSSRFIIILDKEIFLYEVQATNSVVLLSVLYMSVDKLVCNHSFDRSVTVDSGGHFHVLRLPQ